MATQNSINNKAYVFNSDTTITAATNIVATAGNITVGAVSNDANAKALIIQKIHGAAIVSAGDALGEISFKGFDGAAYEVASRITSTVSGTPGAGRVASDLKFYTHQDAAAAAILRMTISDAGCVTIATPDAGTALTITAGGATVTAGAITASAGNLVLTAGDANIGNIAAATTAPFVNLKKSRAGADITSGDVLGSMTFQGYAPTSGYVTGASITSKSSGTIAQDRVAGDLVFATHPNSASGLTPTTRLTIGPAGTLTIAAPDAGTALTITDGGLTVTAGATTLTPLAAATAGIVTKTTAGVLGAIENTANDGYVLISKANASNPVWASLTQGANITITPGANSITIAAGAGGTAWAVDTTGTIALVAGNGYIINKVTLTTATLPATAAVGGTIEITGMGAGGWLIAQRANQMIYFGAYTTTTGIGGSLASTSDRDTIKMICIVADLEFQVISSIGNITYV